jgi:glycerate 2-kinase
MKRQGESVSRSVPLEKQARSVWAAALRAVKPGRLVASQVSLRKGRLVVQGRSYDLRRYGHVYLAAIGKAAPAMAERMASTLAEHLTEGLVLCPPGRILSHPRLRGLPAPHPLPDGRSLKAARAMLSLAGRAGKGDLVIVLLSGGGSAQACLPAEGLTLADKRRVTDSLLRAGATIAELNTVRKHLSRFKGGRLARTAFPATVVNLVLSDVRGNDLGIIASGPTHWDSSTFAQARSILSKYGLWESASPSVRRLIESGVRRRVAETLKKGSRAFRAVESFILGDNRTALDAAAKRARELGLEARVLTAADCGEARKAAGNYAALLRTIVNAGRRTGRPLCLIAGGELTVTVRGRGKGGRNSEFALAFLLEMMEMPPVTSAGITGRRPSWLVASLGTDGIDGPTDAAGAWASGAVAGRAERLGLDPRAFLDRNDSYSFFKKTGSLIRTGPTGTNVMDLRLFLMDPVL